MFEAEIFQHRGTLRRAIRFETLSLRFAEDNRWESAIWEFDTDQGAISLAVGPIEEITSTVGLFDVTVIDGQGGYSGPLTVQSAMCGYPHHAFCFLFRVDADDLWSGHTVARSFGQIAVVPYRFDPS